VTFKLRNLRTYFNSRALSDRNWLANGTSSCERNSSEMYNQIVEELIGLLNPTPNAKLLDVGCGTGEILERVASKYPDICGIDLAPAMVKIVNDKGFLACTLEGDNLPFEDGNFDVVLIYQVLINLPDASIARQLLREAERVTRKGGKILIGAVPHPERSGLPTHLLAWWKNFKIMVRNILSAKGAIPYYAYDYTFFGNIFDLLEMESMTIVPCRVLQGWETKYHVILVK